MQYLILVVMLLIPAWGWALEKHDPIVLKYCAGKQYDKPGSQPFWDCVNGKDLIADQDAEARKTWPPTCEQRMREAMKSVHRAGAIILLPMSKLSDWQQTMADCVK